MKSMPSAVIALTFGLACTVQAHDEITKLEAFGQRAAASLKKSGSFASCTLEGHEVEEALASVSQAYNGNFGTSITIRPYGASASMKVCLVLNVNAQNFRFRE